MSSLGLAFLAAQSAPAAIWSNTELHVQYGSLDTPQFLPSSPEEDKDTLILTLQHASGWKYGRLAAYLSASLESLK